MAHSTKQLILEEALNLFLEKGYHGASMRTLAKRVGLQGSSLYNHFKSKEAIFAALMELAGPQLIGLQIEEILEKYQEHSPVKMIKLIIEKITKNWFQEREALLFLLMIRESPLFSLNVKTRSGQMVQKALLPLTQYIQKLQHQGIFQTDFPAQFFSWTLLAPIANLRLNYLLPNACEEDQTTGRRMIQLRLDYYVSRNFIL
ncbi:MAG: TetR family transcriptional regulator [Calditrichae bacterium]|nr:TetR family transcriptional regulator [Calditrichia bacterium]